MQLKNVNLKHTDGIEHIESKTKLPPFHCDILKFIFLNENSQIPLKISLKFVPNVRFNNIPALVQIMACRQPGNKP